jgi:hypothetical protein
MRKKGYKNLLPIQRERGYSLMLAQMKFDDHGGFWVLNFDLFVVMQARDIRPQHPLHRVPRPAHPSQVLPTSTIIVQFVILLWRGFIHVKILEWNVYKSASRLYFYVPKVYKYHRQFFASFWHVNIKYTFTPLSSFLFPCGNNNSKMQSNPLKESMLNL